MSKLVDKALSKFNLKILPKVEELAYKRYFVDPLLPKPKASLEEYKKIWEHEKSNTYKVVDNLEKELSYKLDEDWFNQLGFITQTYLGQHKICYQHGRVLYSVLRNFIEERGLENINIVETGTARGFSSICMAKAIRDSGISGKIFTFDILPHNTPIYWNSPTDHTQGKLSRAQLLKDYDEYVDNHICFIQGDSRIQLSKVSIPKIHFAFFDGVHNYEFVTKEFNAIKHKQAKGDVVIFDDYSPKVFPGVVKAVDEIAETYSYSTRLINVNDESNYVIARKS